MRLLRSPSPHLPKPVRCVRYERSLLCPSVQTTPFTRRQCSPAAGLLVLAGLILSLSKCARVLAVGVRICAVFPLPPPPLFFFFFPMLQLFRPKWNGCTVVVLRTVVQHAFCLATRFRAVHGRRLTSGQAGYCSQIVPAQRNSRFHKTKLCAVDWK